MMTAMRNTLKKINRTVLEMDLGILFLGVLAQIIGAFIAKDKMMYAGSLWLGILLALAATYHMYRSLDRALDQPEKTAGGENAPENPEGAEKNGEVTEQQNK